MDVSRRRFVATLSASVAAILSFGANSRDGQALGEPTGRAATLGVPIDALSQLGWSSFNAYLLTDFDFSGLQGGRVAGRPATLRLISVRDEDPSRKEDSADEPRCFVLTFSQSSWDRPLRQDTYTVDHFALGRFKLFISDAAVTDGDPTYTAVINRIVK